MNSPIIELQHDVIEAKVPVADLLRKAMLVASKLSLSDILDWINDELSGYGRQAMVPEYREIYGQVQMLDPYAGWTPVVFTDTKLAEACSHRSCVQSIAEVEYLISNPKGMLKIPFPLELQKSLSRDVDLDTEFALFLGPASLVKIVDSVRTAILEWALQLQADGVLGKEWGFTPTEKEVAGNNYQSIINIYGSVHGAQIQQAGPGASLVQQTEVADLTTFLGELRDALDTLGLDAPIRREADAEIATAIATLSSPGPKKAILRESLGSLRTILEGAGGTLAAEMAVELAKFF